MSINYLYNMFVYTIIEIIITTEIIIENIVVINIDKLQNVHRRFVHGQGNFTRKWNK